MSYQSKLNSAATLPTIYNHRSIRKFTEQPLTDEQREAIVEAGRAASSSSFMQCIHIIRVTDTDKRAVLSEVAANQKYVRTAAEFWVFCIDYSKHRLACPEAQLDWTEGLIIGAVDAGIMAQNCLLAAESLGLGGVYIGSLRNDVAKVTEVTTANSAVIWFVLRLSGTKSAISTTNAINNTSQRKYFSSDG